jgi:hypothetical protein
MTPSPKSHLVAGRSVWSRKRTWLAIFAILAALLALWAGYSSSATLDHFNYRLVVLFRDGDDDVKASGVVGITVRKMPLCFLPEVNCVAQLVQGEGIPVRFKNGKLLFVMLGVADVSANVGSMPFEAFRLQPPFKKISELPRTAITLADNIIPTFIEFEKLADPTTAAIVPLDGVAKAVGSDASFVSASVELTDASVASGIGNLLPWVKTEREVKIPFNKNRMNRLQTSFPYWLERND